MLHRRRRRKYLSRMRDKDGFVRRSRRGSLAFFQRAALNTAVEHVAHREIEKLAGLLSSCIEQIGFAVVIMSRARVLNTLHFVS